MSTLTIGGRPPDLMFQKSLDTFAKRHHVRVWELHKTYQGQEVWVAAATHDIATQNREGGNEVDASNRSARGSRARVGADGFAVCGDGRGVREHRPAGGTEEAWQCDRGHDRDGWEDCGGADGEGEGECGGGERELKSEARKQ